MVLHENQTRVKVLYHQFERPKKKILNLNRTFKN